MDHQRQPWAPIANQRIRAQVEQLEPAAREYFEERAGILEFEAQQQRAAAEALALQQTMQAFGITPAS